MLKTLGKTTWDKIKIGEVFAYMGCWEIFYKQDDTGARRLACTINVNPLVNIGCIDRYNWKGEVDIYRLPKSVQKLWKEE